MAYSSVDQVNAQLPNQQQVNATSDPTTTQLQLWIDQDEAQVDVALAAGGAASPATDPAQVKAIGMLVTGQGVRRVVAKRTGEKIEEPNEFSEALELMRQGKWAGNVAAADGTVGPRSFTMDAPNDSSVYDARDPVFKRDQAHQW